MKKLIFVVLFYSVIGIQMINGSAKGEITQLVGKKADTLTNKIILAGVGMPLRLGNKDISFDELLKLSDKQQDFLIYINDRSLFSRALGYNALHVEKEMIQLLKEEFSEDFLKDVTILVRKEKERYCCNNRYCYRSNYCADMDWCAGTSFPIIGLCVPGSALTVMGMIANAGSASGACALNSCLLAGFGLLGSCGAVAIGSGLLKLIHKGCCVDEETYTFGSKKESQELVLGQ